MSAPAMKAGLAIFRVRYDGGANLFGAQDVYQAKKSFFAIGSVAS
jgi:hypothetical protein